MRFAKNQNFNPLLILLFLLNYSPAFAGGGGQLNPSITADGPTTFCEGENVVLTSSAANTYQWSTGDTTQSITVTASGGYYVAVTDTAGNTGVSDTVQVTVYPIPEPEITASGSTEFCQGDSIMLSTDQAASYEWSSGETTQSIYVSTPGFYSVTVANAGGCEGTSGIETITVLPTTPAVIIPDQQPPYCQGDEVTLTTSFTLFGDYLWSTGETTQSITVNSSGIYTVTVTNSFGCSDTAIYPMAFLPNPPIFANADGPLEFCEGGEVELSVSFAFGLDLEWSPNGETTQSITVTESGTYNVTGTSTLTGCSSTSEDFVVNVVPVPEADAGSDIELCNEQEVTLSASGGELFQWSTGETSQMISVVPETGANIFTLSATNPGCNITDVDTVIIYLSGLNADFTHEGGTFVNDPVVFTDISTGQITSWLWDFGDGDTAASANTAHLFDEEGGYEISLIVTDTAGCMDTAVTQLIIDGELIIPNVFTPNHDGANDIFKIRNAGNDAYKFVVYNRWGQKVFVQEAPEIRWDGNTNAGMPLNKGTYFYRLKVDWEIGEEAEEKSGFITMIK